MAIGEICNREVVFARRDESVKSAAELMREHHVGDLVIVEEANGQRVPCGVLTDRDIVVGVVAKGLDPDTLEVAEVAGSELVLARESDGVAETIELMRAKGVRRVPIVDARGSLVGIVTADDIVDLLAEELTAVAGIVSREQRREIQLRK
ncbi:MAG TPA: CBS domain-containing protein [Burkholderiales bacterium]|nr:CBS domain-containing protein [Burkholderiales bacterium]